LHYRQNQNQNRIDHREKNEAEEKSVISFTYTSAKPFAVMIETEDAVVAIVTM
tara:strand:- start:521 stop:679 length:159 start_codon:yes stop_codon:yes gene_type:complete